MRFHCVFQFFGMLLIIGLFSCEDAGKKEDADNFDREVLLTHYAKQFILPAYSNLADRTLALQNAARAFRSNTNESNLQTLRNAWKDAALVWQTASHFNFGPAGEEGLRKGLVEEVGTFPVSVSKLESNVSTGQWNTADFNRDARGFLAIEYLLYANNQTNAQLVSAFLAAPKRLEYLIALTEDVHKRVSAVNDAWGSYQADFVKNAGTDVGSSTSMLYNEFVRSYEALKNFKVGVPLGKRAGQTKSEPQLAEAYHSGISLELLRTHFNALENLWYGRASVSGPGFKAYLESTVGGKELVASTEAQLNAVKQAFAAVPTTPSMAEQIRTSPAKLEALHTELQKLTRFFKSDLSSLLGIAITFSSGDGD